MLNLAVCHFRFLKTRKVVWPRSGFFSYSTVWLVEMKRRTNGNESMENGSSCKGNFLFLMFLEKTWFFPSSFYPFFFFGKIFHEKMVHVWKSNASHFEDLREFWDGKTGTKFLMCIIQSNFCFGFIFLFRFSSIL